MADDVRDTAYDFAPMTQRQGELQGAGWPWPLIKATQDDFDYAIGLRDGSVIRFDSARDDGSPEWVTLEHDGLEIIKHGPSLAGLGYTYDRGLVVRVREIVWATDAPEGS